MLDSVARGAVAARQAAVERDPAAIAAARELALLSPREREVLEGLLAGLPNKSIAYDLAISPRTVEIHRARVMDKMGARSFRADPSRPGCRPAAGLSINRSGSMVPLITRLCCIKVLLDQPRVLNRRAKPNSPRPK